MNPEFSYLSEVTPDKGNLIKGLQLVQGLIAIFSSNCCIKSVVHLGNLGSLT